MLQADRQTDFKEPESKGWTAEGLLDYGGDPTQLAAIARGIETSLLKAALLVTLEEHRKGPASGLSPEVDEQNFENAQKIIRHELLRRMALMSDETEATQRKSLSPEVRKSLLGELMVNTPESMQEQLTVAGEVLDTLFHWQIPSLPSIDRPENITSLEELKKWENTAQQQLEAQLQPTRDLLESSDQSLHFLQVLYDLSSGTDLLDGTQTRRWADVLQRAKDRLVQKTRDMDHEREYGQRSLDSIIQSELNTISAQQWEVITEQSPLFKVQYQGLVRKISELSARYQSHDNFMSLAAEGLADPDLEDNLKSAQRELQQLKKQIFDSQNVPAETKEE